MKTITFTLFLVMVISSHAIYEIGDVVEDFTFLESDGGTPVQSSLYEHIDAGKVVLITFGGLG